MSRALAILLLVSLLLLVACGSGDEPGSAGGGSAAAPGETPPPPPDPEARRLLAEGDALIATDPARAIETLSASIAKQETAAAYLARARARLATATAVLPGVMPPGVGEDLEKALALDPDSLPALWFRAERTGIGRQEAQATLRRMAALPAGDDDAEALLARARAVASLRDPSTEQEQRAQRDFARVAELRPEDAAARLHWGRYLLRKLRRPDEAERVLRECVELDPDGRAGKAAADLLDEG